MRFVLLTSIILLPLMAWGQNDAQITEADGATPAAEDRDSVRRYYIKDFPDYFFLYPVLKQRGLNFELARNDRSALLTYKPNNTYNLGVGVYLFEVGLEFAFAIPLREKSLRRYGESRSRDLQLHVLAKRWGLDAFYQRYKGFYIVDRENPPQNNTPFPQRPDIGTKNFGFTWYYVFNHQRFSFRSAYNFSERQLYSSGSFLLYSTLYTFRVAADSSIVPGARQNEFGDHVGFTRLRYTTFSVAPGYTYNLTYNHFFLNATLALGPAHHWVHYDLEASGDSRQDIEIHAFLGGRVAIGYNGYRIFGGISFISQGSRVRFDDSTFSNNNSVFKILLGYRFNETGVLKKRLWDMLPLNF